MQKRITCIRLYCSNVYNVHPIDQYAIDWMSFGVMKKYFPVLLASVLSGCAISATSRPEFAYRADAPMVELATCVNEGVQTDRRVSVIPPVSSANSVTLTRVLLMCGGVTMACQRSILWIARFEPISENQSRIVMREHLNIRGERAFWTNDIAPVVTACVARLSGGHVTELGPVESQVPATGTPNAVQPSP